MHAPAVPARAAGAAGPGFVPNINGFRGLCVLMVFVHHVANSGLPPKADSASAWQTGLYEAFMSFGYGVELFFMISGYVIVLSLRRHASIGAFLKDRVLRIFPVWVPLMLLLALAGTLGGWRVFAHTDWWQWLAVVVSNLLLLPPLLPLPVAHPASWSLSYEWVFYLTAAAGAALARRRLLPTPAHVLQGAGAFAMWGLGAALLMACFPRGLFFLPGVWVALCPGLAQQLARSARLAPLSLAVMLYAWYGTGIFAAEYGRPLWQVVAEGQALGVPVALLAGTHLFACVASLAAPGTGLLRTRALQALGTISYSFYLVHPMVMFAVKKAVVALLPAAHGSWAATAWFGVGSAVVSLLLAWASWRWLEKALARWLKAHWGGGAPAAPRASGMPRREAA